MSRFLIFFGIVAIVLGAAIYFINSREEEQETDNSQVQISASIYPLAHFAQEVVGDNATVDLITSQGVDAHTFEPSPIDVLKITNSDLFIYNGADLDAWAEKIVINLDSKKTLEATSFIDLLEIGDEHEHEDDDHHEEDEHSHPGFDPHFWLSTDKAKEVTQAIKEYILSNKLIAKESIDSNYKNFINRLDILDQDYQQGLASCQQRKIIVAHDAFNYLADKYDIEIIAIAGISPQDEPSARGFADIVKEAQEHNIQFVFFETQSNPRLAKALAEEIGAQTLVLNPLESISFKDDQDYISVMRDNLANLRVAMGCQ